MKLFRHTPADIPQCTLDETNHTYTTPNGNLHGSVTTMLGKTKSEEQKQKFRDWRERMGDALADHIKDTSAIIGTQTHKLNENYVNMEYDLCNYLLLSHAHHRNFIPYINKISNVYAVEPRMYSDEMRLAGTPDWVGVYDGKVTIGDYKTKRTSQRIEWMDDYFIQATAYSRMWREHTGQQIEQIVILASSEQNTIQEFISTPSDHYNALECRLQMFHNN